MTPPGKRAGRYLMTVLFLLGTVVILSFPTSTPTLREGEIAQEPYAARITFQVLDEEATRRVADKAKERCPRIFTESAGHLQRIPRELEDFLFAMLEARNIEELLPAAGANWGFTREKIEWFRTRLDDAWIRSAIEPVEKTLRKVAESGIMDGNRRQLEINSERYDFVVQSKPDAEKGQRRFIARVIEYPDGLEKELAEELRPILKDKPQRFREYFIDLLVHRATPTLKWNKRATDEALRAAADSVEPRYRTIFKDSIILDVGQVATRSDIEDIKAEARAFSAQGSMARDREGEADHLRKRIRRAVGVTGLFLVGALLLALYAVRATPQVLRSNTRVFGVYTVSLITLTGVRVLEELGITLHWSPVVLAVMILTVACGPTLAYGVAALLAIVAGVATDSGLALAVPLFAGGFAATLSLYQLRRRTDLIEAGVIAGAAHLIMVWVLYLAGLHPGGPTAAWPLRESLAGVGGGVLAGFVMTGILPYVERFFDVATDLRLFEWTDQNQPLLRKLALDAPGSYHHSTIVSNMAEAAAEEIGANALLARTGGYLHDVGKMSRPEYYIENTGGMPNPHEKLSPMMSTMILTAHTKDGAELADQCGVPSPIRHIIAEHHGTSVVEFFYGKAKKDAEPSFANVSADTFRYRGPRPRSPESAIVMLADSVESAARSLVNASPSSIEKLVQNIVRKRLEDGQLDDSRMSITDIRRVEKSLVRSLLAISHPRIRYPAIPEFPEFRDKKTGSHAEGAPEQ